MKNIPLGIKVLALFNSLGVVVLGVSSFLKRFEIALSFSKFDIVLFAALVTLMYIIAVGLWRMRGWVRYVYILHFVLNIISLYLRGSLGTDVRVLIGVLLEAGVIAYLFYWPRAREVLK